MLRIESDRHHRRTGRMFRSARQIAEELDIKEALICYQGAMIAHATTGEVLYHKTVPLELAEQIIAETEQRGLHLNVYANDEIFVSKITPHALFYSRINMDMPLHPVGDLKAWLAAQRVEPTKLVIITDPEQTDSTLATFTELFGDKLQVTKSHPRFTEFTNAECSKGRALAFLADYCGLQREEVMAIGDGHNDLDMLTWAGYGVAMSTAPQDVLSASRIVTAALAEDGAAQAIERYVLESYR